MGKKGNLIFAALVFAVLTVFLVESVGAFCVYNKTDTEIGAQELYLFRGMNKDHIPPGGSECCHWSNKDCNPDGKRDSTVTLRIGYQTSAGPFICEVEIKAGGWLNVSGKKDDGIRNFKCEAHYNP